MSEVFVQLADRAEKGDLEAFEVLKDALRDYGLETGAHVTFPRDYDGRYG